MANDLLSECIYSVVTIFVKIMTSEFHVTFEYDSKCFIIYILDIPFCCFARYLILYIYWLASRAKFGLSDQTTKLVPALLAKRMLTKNPVPFTFYLETIINQYYIRKCQQLTNGHWLCPRWRKKRHVAVRFLCRDKYLGFSERMVKESEFLDTLKYMYRHYYR